MNLKVRLAVMNFLEFAVWGAYLTSMGNYLGRAGMGGEISWFYAIQGIVSIFMPTLMGIVADRLIQPQRLLGICHLVAGLFMCGLCYIGTVSATPDKPLFITLYTLSVAFYMPTLALSNTAAFTILKSHGMDTVSRLERKLFLPHHCREFEQVPIYPTPVPCFWNFGHRSLPILFYFAAMQDRREKIPVHC